MWTDTGQDCMGRLTCGGDARCLFSLKLVFVVGLRGSLSQLISTQQQRAKSRHPECTHARRKHSSSHARPCISILFRRRGLFNHMSIVLFSMDFWWRERNMKLLNCWVTFQKHRGGFSSEWDEWFWWWNAVHQDSVYPGALASEG